MAMNKEAGNQIPERSPHRVLLLLVIGLAAFSSAMNELNQLQEPYSSSQYSLIGAWTDVMVPDSERQRTCCS